MHHKVGDGQNCNCLGRRNFLGMLAAATALSVPGFASPASADALTKELRDKLTPEQIIQAMKKGNNRFRKGERKERNYLREQKASASGQYPAAALLTCIDSRAPRAWRKCQLQKQYRLPPAQPHLAGPLNQTN
jgi:carbonic anhydrase